MPEPEAKVEEVKEISESPEVPKELIKTTGEDKKVESAPETPPESPIEQKQKLYDEIAKSKSEEVDTPVSEEPKEEFPSEEPQPEIDIKASIQDKIDKRIGKEVAKRKTLEEQVEDQRVEIEKLRTKDPVVSNSKETSEPTDEQIDGAYEKALSDGDYKFATQINRYMVNREKDKALDEVKKTNDKQTQVSQETTRKWVTLIKDFTTYNDDGTIDMSHPLNLNNNQSHLYQTAMSFMNDKKLAVERGYNNTDKILGFRLAVNDARRDLCELADEGKLDLDAHKPKVIDKLIIQPKQRRKSELATPVTDSAGNESTPQVMSRKDKVTQEIERRQKMKDTIGVIQR